MPEGMPEAPYAVTNERDKKMLRATSRSPPFFLTGDTWIFSPLFYPTTFFLLTFGAVSGLLHDIAINLFSDALWAIGGFLVAHIAFFKKVQLVPFKRTTFKKIFPGPLKGRDLKKMLF